MTYKLIVMLHLLGASVWVGGHVILSLVVLPPALRQRDPAPIRAFEQRFEKVGIPALALQVASGLWLAHYWIPDWTRWFAFGSPQAALIAVKLGLLGLTALLGVHARWRLIPRLTADTLPQLAGHIIAVTLLSLGFLVAGSGIRLGGLSW
jgi:putative copper export protein